MKRLFLLVGMLAMPSFAAVSANVAFTSDYVWRGMTQSDGPAIQGGFDFEAEGGFYAGIWGSNVNFNDGAGSELDYYAGYGFSMGDVGVDIGYIAFDYPENQTGLDFEEIYLGLSFGDLGTPYEFAATQTCPIISAKFRFLENPCLPVAQKLQSTAQPTCEETHKVALFFSGINTISIRSLSPTLITHFLVPSFDVFS